MTRAATIRRIAALALLLSLGAVGCGHYGPPERDPVRTSTRITAGQAGVAAGPAQEICAEDEKNADPKRERETPR